jgi:hypothetical protein
MQILRTETLYCTTGGSDKTYRIELVETFGEYQVWAYYGKRLSVLKSIRKGMSYNRLAAEEVFEKLLSDKLKTYRRNITACSRPVQTQPDGLKPAVKAKKNEDVVIERRLVFGNL